MNLHMTVCEECQMPHCIHYLEPVGSLLGAKLEVPPERLIVIVKYCMCDIRKSVENQSKTHPRPNL
jgi:hypothetical protein